MFRDESEKFKNHALGGQVLFWSCWDVAGVIAAAMQQMLPAFCRQLGGSAEQPVRPRRLPCSSPWEIPELAHSLPVGLAVWVVADEAQFPAVCLAVAQLRSQSANSVCLAYGTLFQSEQLHCLAEAGMQLIVRDLPQLQRALPRALAKCPLSSAGYHPLTSGLLSRLPWPP